MLCLCSSLSGKLTEEQNQCLYEKLGETQRLCLWNCLDAVPD